MDCFFNEGIKVLYRVAMAILLLFYKYSAPQHSEWMNEILNNGIDSALTKFCKQIPVSYKCIGSRCIHTVRGRHIQYSVLLSLSSVFICFNIKGCFFLVGIHSALVRINEELLERKVAALV
jgi:hypothetical protein